MERKKILGWLFLLAIITTAFFVRVYDIENAPPAIYPDEAVNGEDALRALETGQFQWFYHANQGREGLFMNIIAVLFKFFGASTLTLKFPAIFFGTLTVLGTYLLSKELFQKERLATISAFMVAFSYWAINFNRISFRANMLPFILVFSFYFFYRGLRTNKLWTFILSGFFLGLGLHTYIAVRIAPLIFVALFIALALSYENFIKRYWKGLLAFGFAALLAALPMLVTLYVTHPEYRASRSGSISVLSPEVNKGNLPKTLVYTVTASLIKYNFVGDMNWRHNFPPFPLLDPISGSAFLLGIGYSLAMAIYLLWQRFINKLRDERLPLHALLLSWFFVMLVPEFMTNEGLPHSLRAIGTLPVVFIFGAMTLNYLWEQTDRHGSIFRFSARTLIVGSLLFMALFNVVKYHIVWANRVETARSFDVVLRDVSDYIRTVPAEKEKFLFINNPIGRVPIKVINNKMPNVTYLYRNEYRDVKPKNRNNFVVVLTELDHETIYNLEQMFPGIKTKEIRDRFGIPMYVLEIK